MVEAEVSLFDAALEYITKTGCWQSQQQITLNNIKKGEEVELSKWRPASGRCDAVFRKLTVYIIFVGIKIVNFRSSLLAAFFRNYASVFYSPITFLPHFENKQQRGCTRWHDKVDKALISLDNNRMCVFF